MDVDSLRTMNTEQLKAIRSRIDAMLDGPADGMGDLDAAVSEMKAMREKIAVTGKAAVTRAIKAFLIRYPEVESVRWTQYTPYFNDGDACVFSVREPEVRLADATGEEGDDEDGYMGGWELGYEAKRAGRPEPEALMASLKELETLFDQAEDAMKATFGDHVRVTVGRGGEADVEEYDHD